jgi:diguanylate cyclase (GGDEF)-like protein
VTSPLLVESMSLLDNARKMRSLVFRASLGGETVGNLDEQIAQIHEDSNNHLQALRRLASQAGVGGRLEAAEQLGQEFSKTLDRMVASYRREQGAARQAKQSLADFAAYRHEISAMLVAVSKRAETELNKSASDVKARTRSGDVTVGWVADVFESALSNTYPLVQNANKLLGEVDQIDQTIKLFMAQSDPTGTDALEANVMETFKTIDAVSAKFADGMHLVGGDTQATEIEETFAQLRDLVLGADGVMAHQRDALAAQADLDAGRVVLERIDRAYLAMLDEVKDVVAGIDSQARKHAIKGITSARSAVTVSIVLAILASLTFGSIFAHRLTAPLRRLTEHAVEISKSGELRTLTEDAITSRIDEIGVLSRSFNRMIEELADARQRLIAWSEAEVRKQYDRLNDAINNMPQGLCMFDAEQNLIICNARYAHLYALPAELTVPGTPLRAILQQRLLSGAYAEIKSPDDFVEERLAAVSSGANWYSVNTLRDGRMIAVSHQPLANGGSVATHEDVTERRKVEAQIEYLAHHDALTRLPNRVRLREQMVQALHRVDRGESLAVLCLDLDHFKDVNDTLGHPIGDALLQAVSDRIRATLRPDDCVARLGGDEFAIVQAAQDQPVGATALAARLIRELGAPYEIQGHQVVVGTSIGIAVAPNDGSDPDRLMKNADMALYRAKEDGRGVYRFFEAEMDARMQARRALELDLRKALALGEFEVFYQPLVLLDRNRVGCFEALLRWRSPERGLIVPDNFVPLAEEIGLIAPIGAWVLKQACGEAMKWPSDIKVAVNLSPVQFKTGTIVLDVLAALGASGLPASRLELEITESVLLQDTENTLSTLNQLKDLGLRISMDDFGTGYSSLAYLRKFPFDKIKIDRSFIRDLGDKPDTIAIVRAVAGLGSTLGISTTAEGVENENQLEQLRREGCTEVQGYLFSKPLPATEIASLLDDLNSRSSLAA